MMRGQKNIKLQELSYTFWVKLELSSHSYHNFHLQFQNNNVQQRKTESWKFMRPQAMFFHRQEVHYRTTQLHGHAFSCVNCCCSPISLFT